jgi:hypothetical protein
MEVPVLVVEHGILRPLLGAQVYPVKEILVELEIIQLQIMLPVAAVVLVLPEQIIQAHL